jgi:hypothetical protein
MGGPDLSSLRAHSTGLAVAPAKPPASAGAAGIAAARWPVQSRTCPSTDSCQALGETMPTVIGYHQAKDTQHCLASPKREEFFGPLGVTNIRTFVPPSAARPRPHRGAPLGQLPRRRLRWCRPADPQGALSQPDREQLRAGERSPLPSFSAMWTRTPTRRRSSPLVKRSGLTWPSTRTRPASATTTSSGSTWCRRPATCLQ